MNSITKISSTNNKNNKNNSNSTHKSSSFSHRITSSISSSSSSSFSSYNSSLELEDFSLPNSPSTSSKIPFSWESIPGIPKTQILRKIDSSKKLPFSNKNLPLPPHVSTTSSSSDNITCNKSFKQKKSYITRSNDPFFDALVECSKGGDEDDIIGGSSIWKGSVKSLSARFGLVNLSCKNSSSIAHSLVFVPKVGPRRISYFKKRFG